MTEDDLKALRHRVFLSLGLDQPLPRDDVRERPERIVEAFSRMSPLELFEVVELLCELDRRVHDA